MGIIQIGGDVIKVDIGGNSKVMIKIIEEIIIQISHLTNSRIIINPDQETNHIPNNNNFNINHNNNIILNLNIICQFNQEYKLRN